MIDKKNWLLIHTDNYMFQINLDVKNINELILQLQHIIEDLRQFENVKYYIINGNKVTNW